MLPATVSLREYMPGIAGWWVSILWQVREAMMDSARILGSALAAVALGIVLLGGCASGPDERGKENISGSHEHEGGIHVVSEAPEDCPVCAVYETSSASVVRITRPGSQGAGVVMDDSGRIITNAHVVGDEDRVIVETASHTIVRGFVVRRDTAIDLALIETGNPDVRWTPIGRDVAEAVRIGSDVYVIGHPVGLGWTVTRGIVSARRAPSSERPGGLLQTDAAISPGNSGGALLDGHGHLIGIVQSKVAEPNAENVSFAIPLDAVLSFMVGEDDS